MVDALEGVRVLDFTQLEQGPSATQVLADFGADVIKIERIGTGEIGRRQFPTIKGYSPHWSATNRNKRSLSVDLKTDTGRNLVLDLARHADIVASNFRPDVMDELHLGWDDLSQINPRIIVAYASGYGRSGPYAKRRGQDLAAQAISGLMALTGTAGGPPTPSGTFIADYMASMQFAQGMMLALLARERTGRGQVVDTSLLNTAISSHLQEGTTYLTQGQEYPRPAGGVAHAHNTALYGTYQCKDGKWLVLIGEFYIPQPWVQCTTALGLSDDVVHDPRFQSNDLLLQNTESASAIIHDACRRFDRNELIERFAGQDVLAAPVNDYEEVFADPQVLHNEMVLNAEIPSVGPVKFVGIPIKLSETPGRLRLTPPTVGQHNEEILTEAGVAPERIQALKDDGVIGSEHDAELSGSPASW